MSPKLKNQYSMNIFLGFGFFNYVTIFVSAMVLNTATMLTTDIGFVLPVAQCDLNLTASHKGILASASFAGIIFSSLFWGFLADTKGRRSVIRPTILMAFLICLASCRIFINLLLYGF